MYAPDIWSLCARGHVDDLPAKRASEYSPSAFPVIADSHDKLCESFEHLIFPVPNYLIDLNRLWTVGMHCRGPNKNSFNICNGSNSWSVNMMFTCRIVSNWLFTPSASAKIRSASAWWSFNRLANRSALCIIDCSDVVDDDDILTANSNYSTHSLRTLLYDSYSLLWLRNKQRKETYRITKLFHWVQMQCESNIEMNRINEMIDLIEYLKWHANWEELRFGQNFQSWRRTSRILFCFQLNGKMNNIIFPSSSSYSSLLIFYVVDRPKMCMKLVTFVTVCQSVETIGYCISVDGISVLNIFLSNRFLFRMHLKLYNIWSRCE